MREGGLRAAFPPFKEIDQMGVMEGIQTRPAAAARPLRVRARFASWRHTRPFWAGLWALIAGGLMWFWPMHALQFLFITQTPIWAGILVGVLVELFGLFLWLQPQLKALLGALILLFSVLSFFTSDFGGFFVGMLLGILAGSMALSWTPLRRRAAA
jgi:uncharacterized protein DUF6114